MFQFTGLSSLELCIHSRILNELSRFPHSEISGSKIAYISPKHIVVCHVLLRLLMPRHPLCALINLTFLIYHQSFLTIDEFEILISISLDKKLITQITILSNFQRTKSERIISQNQVKMVE